MTDSSSDTVLKTAEIYMTPGGQPVILLDREIPESSSLSLRLDPESEELNLFVGDEAIGKIAHTHELMRHFLLTQAAMGKASIPFAVASQQEDNNNAPVTIAGHVKILGKDGDLLDPKLLSGTSPEIPGVLIFPTGRLPFFPSGEGETIVIESEERSGSASKSIVLEKRGGFLTLRGDIEEEGLLERLEPHLRNTFRPDDYITVAAQSTDLRESSIALKAFLMRQKFSVSEHAVPLGVGKTLPEGGTVLSMGSGESDTPKARLVFIAETLKAIVLSDVTRSVARKAAITAGILAAASFIPGAQIPVFAFLAARTGKNAIGAASTLKSQMWTAFERTGESYASARKKDGNGVARAAFLAMQENNTRWGRVALLSVGGLAAAAGVFFGVQNMDAIMDVATDAMDSLSSVAGSSAPVPEPSVVSPVPDVVSPEESAVLPVVDVPEAQVETVFEEVPQEHEKSESEPEPTLSPTGTEEVTQPTAVEDPSGTETLFRDSAEEVTQEPQPVASVSTDYTIQKGDTLGDIARRHNVDLLALIAENKDAIDSMGGSRSLDIGATLTIPDSEQVGEWKGWSDFAQAHPEEMQPSLSSAKVRGLALAP